MVDNKGNKKTASLKLGVTVRQVDRLINKYKEQGKSAFIHGNKGRKPAITKPKKTRQDVVDLYRTKYNEKAKSISYIITGRVRLMTLKNAKRVINTCK